jgi:circadian clock protein KaiC
MRLIDFLKVEQITALLTSLIHSGSSMEESEVSVSSLIDTWLFMRDLELGGERNRGLYVLKARGIAHSNQVREFLITGHGIELKEVYVGPEGVLTGSLRLAQEAREQEAALSRQHGIERRQRDLERKRKALQIQLAAQQTQFEDEQEELRLLIAQEQAALERTRQDRKEMARSRKANDLLPEAVPPRSRKVPAQGERK